MAPTYPAFLACVEFVAGDTVRTLQLAGALTGALSVLLTGILGRLVAGPRVALVAAVLAASSPLLIAADGSLMSETLFVPLVLAALILATAARSRRGSRPAAQTRCG